VSDAERVRGLRRMQAVALGLLVLAAVVYVLTFGDEGFLGYVNAGAEASMVGAVADWFAVTALFRRPLGLPIPHTALVPERKDALGRSLEQFVTESFLTGEVARDRVLAAEPALRVGRWIALPDNAARVVREVAPAVGRALRGIGDDELRAFVEQALLPRLRSEQLAPVAGHLLEGVLRDGAHRVLVDLVLREGHGWLADHEETVSALLRERAPWWSPPWLDDRVVDRVYAEMLTWVADVRDDPGHRARVALDSLLEDLARDLQHDDDVRARAEALKERLLDNPGTADAATAVAESVRTAVVDSLADADGPLHQRAREALVRLGERLVDDRALRAATDARAADAVVFLVDTYGAEVAATISHTIERWDGHEAARRMELLVGRDLQFIRINGTVVGGLVGVTIHAVSQLL
jgi:uncharacterized membrane-anchored protein YjiN (DUF445 family)